MKFPSRHFAWLIPVLCLLALLVGAFRALRPVEGMDLQGFGVLPVVSNGRVQPLDSLARNGLLAIHGKQRVPGDDPPSSPIGWLAELAFEPAVADQRPVFVVQHDDLLGLLELNHDDGSTFSFVQLLPRLGEMGREASRIVGIEAPARSPYEKALMKLWGNLGLYQQLKFALAHPQSSQLESDFELLLSSSRAAIEETGKQAHGEEFDESILQNAAARMKVMRDWSSQVMVFTKPPSSGRAASDWHKLPDAAIESIEKGSLDPSTLAFARLGDAWRAQDVSAFNQAISEYHSWLENHRSGDLGKVRAETTFNRLAPFYVCMALYVVALLCAILSWLGSGDALRLAAFRVLTIGIVIHTIGLIVRMSLEGRPPVTNLYSSAVFIGWGAIVLSMLLELFHRNAIGTAVAAMTGFATLVIAHHLSLSGDTLEMMRAVLDSNFWLATHVIVITLGYSATFLAGAIAIIYLLRHAFGGVPKPAALSMRGMVYGTLCFATLASFVGTVLGGIWADQSWGRFWGWDPKENGALLIVLWNAIILHARWGGMIREKGIMVMAVFGNIVTSWSWFGTNMLGIGLHSYGFTDAAFFWLSVFIISQLLIMALGLVPRKIARSVS